MYQFSNPQGKSNPELLHSESADGSRDQRGKKAGFGVLRAVNSLRSSIEEIGMSKADTELARLTDEIFSQKRRFGGSEKFFGGNYGKTDDPLAKNISQFVGLIQKGEVDWQRDSESGVLSTTLEIPVYNGSGRVRYYFGSTMDYSAPIACTASLSLERSDRFILARTQVKRQPYFPPVSIAAPKDYLNYEDALHIDTSSKHFQLYKSSGNNNAPLGYRVLSNSLQDPEGNHSFNVGTMGAPEIFPSPTETRGQTED